MDCFRVTVNFYDGEQRFFFMEELNVFKFLDLLKKGEIYWTENKKVGYWTDIMNIRDIIFEQNPEANNEQLEQSEKSAG